ncbi:MAG: hypothetical protein JWQ40_2990 [Segetibacter sp.]|nr:hypothetical protein [Segetibacter sp.]
MVVYNVVAKIEIDGSAIKNYYSVQIKQRFNEHHEFSIRLPYDVIEKEGDFSLNNVKKLIGKVAIIGLERGNGKVLNEFKGIISNVGIEQVDTYHSEIILKGYSPTIMMENGAHTTSFSQKDLSKIAKEVMKDVLTECKVNIAPAYKTPIKYFTQYKESNFSFLNRISAEFGEWFYYNGKELFFGKPAMLKDIDLVSGEDVTSLQLKLQLLPASFKTISYQSKENTTAISKSPSTADGLGEYGKFALTESGKIFSEVTNPNVRPRVDTGAELDNFLKTQKAAIAAELEVISGTSINPEIKLGSVATISICERVNNNFSKREHGKFLITAVTHEISENGNYKNSFEGLPASVKVVPVKNRTPPVAESQVGVVTSNSDPENLGRVKVRLLWQENGTTDWIRVLTPDAGSGGKSQKNRGYVFIPEVNDEVIVGFRYNDPDRPFVIGSLFHGKNAAGGGKDNKIKTLGTNSGNTITMDDDKGSMFLEDAKGNSVLIDGAGKIVINCSEQIELKTGDSSIIMKKDGTIQITGKMKVEVKSDQTVDIEGTSKVGIKGTNIAVNANANLDLAANANLSAKANAQLALEGTAMAKLSSAAMAEITAALVKIN